MMAWVGRKTEDVAYFKVLSQYFLAAIDRNHDSQYGNTILQSKIRSGAPVNIIYSEVL